MWHRLAIAKPALMALVLLLSLLFYSCNFKNKIDGVFTSKADTALDNQRAVEKSIVAKEGGDINLASADGTKIEITFPPDALEKDAVLRAAPLSKAGDDDKDGLDAGFSLEEKGAGHGPSLRYPAILVFNFDRELGKNTSIIRYNGDKDFDVLPTNVTMKDGKTRLTTEADHFSVFRICLENNPKCRETVNSNKDHGEKG
ncbi:MAG: hypothetical protein M3362_10430, partial [Acidobacteriota bacterium]|nr:hypothetical protein [Acidobacteriota bacterium]